MSINLRKIIANGTAISLFILFKSLGDKSSSLVVSSGFKLYCFSAVVTGSMKMSITAYNQQRVTNYL